MTSKASCMGLLVACFAPILSRGNPIDSGLWPLPDRVSSGNGIIEIRDVRIVYHGEPCLVATHVQQRLKDAFDWGTRKGEKDPFLQVPVAQSLLAKMACINTILIHAYLPIDYPNPGTDEGYELSVPWCEHGAFCEEHRDGDERYARCSQVEIRAETAVGAAHAAETLLQLVRRSPALPEVGRGGGGGEAAGAGNVAGENSSRQTERLVIFGAPWEIVDMPRFPHRGLLIDTSRNFLPVEALLQTITAMAASKLNVLHWHIIDAPSFPLDLPSSPSLARLGAYAPHQTYSKEEVLRIVAFAAARGVRVLPELDMPGHSFSWSHAVPHLITCANAQPWEKYCSEPPCGQLDPTLEETYLLVSSVMRDVSAMFQDVFMHLGADEINYKCWQHSPQLMHRVAAAQRGPSAEPPTPPEEDGSHAKSGAHDESLRRLWQAFEDNVLRTAATLGKHVVFWQDVFDEGLSLPPNTTIQAWKGTEDVEKIARAGHRVILSPAEAWYLDCGHGSWVDGGRSWCDPYKTWEVMWSFEPLESVSAAAAHMIIGGEACMWTEQVDEHNVHSRVWPRAAAVAERLWSPRHVTDIGAAKRRLAVHRERLVSNGIFASPIHPSFCTRVPGSCDSHAGGSGEMESRGVVEFPSSASALADLD